MKRNESPTFDHMDNILQASELAVPVGINRQLTFPPFAIAGWGIGYNDRQLRLR